MSHLLDLESFIGEDGFLTTIESSIISGFSLERVFWIYSVPSGCSRADHACMNAFVVLVAVSGSVTIAAETFDESKIYTLENKEKALILEPGTWIKAYDFSEDAVLMCLSNKKYEECTYINNYDEYVKTKGKLNGGLVK